jgi:hypothetical protein
MSEVAADNQRNHPAAVIADEGCGRSVALFAFNEKRIPGPIVFLVFVVALPANPINVRPDSLSALAFEIQMSSNNFLFYCACLISYPKKY